jgi:hypothetical protein
VRHERRRGVVPGNDGAYARYPPRVRQAMDKRHKDLLRRTVGDLRRALAGGEDARGEWQRGDLDRELERLGIAPDGRRTPSSTLLGPGGLDQAASRHSAAS